MKIIFHNIPDISGAAKCSLALRKAFITERIVWSEITGIMMIKRYWVMCFALALNPGAMRLTMTPLNMRNSTDMHSVTSMDRFMKVEYMCEYSSLFFRYFEQTGTRNALVAPEKNRV